MMKTIAVTCVVTVLGITGGCGTDAESTGAHSDWSFERDALRFEEDLYVSEAEDFFIGSADDIAVDADGQMYVVDGEEHHVKVLSPEGDLLETIGREGEGPGEFQQLEEIVLARSDSLYVLDVFADRISVFAPDYDFAYSFTAQTERGGPSTILVPDALPGYILTYPPALRPGSAEEKLLVRRVGARGAVGDTLFLARRSQETHVAESGGLMRVFYAIPFARSPHFAVGPAGNVHYAWNDSLHVTSYDGTGRLLRAVDVPFEAVHVTESDRERVMDRRSSEQRAALRSVIRDTKPAFIHFLVDDEGRYWFKRPTADHERVAWWMVDPEAHRVLTARLPAHVDFAVIRNGYAYGTIAGGDNPPAVVRYRVIE